MNGAPCHQRYGKKHRMKWENERKVQKGAEGKEEIGPTTCLSLSLSLSGSLTPLLTPPPPDFRGGGGVVVVTGRVFISGPDSAASAGFGSTVLFNSISDWRFKSSGGSSGRLDSQVSLRQY